MHEDATFPGRDVVLGFNGAWGFAAADLTSPALAAAAGALVDVTLSGQPGTGAPATGRPVTELRVHGVSGSDAPTMLEHPAAVQVAGDSVTRFYRRWSPDGPGRLSVPWPLEAYSWGGLTEAPLASASWLVLVPFMLYNVAHFALPPRSEPTEADRSAGSESVQHLDTTWEHRLASGLLRLLALAATVQLVTGAAVVTVSTVAWQAAGRAGMLPSWLGWYGRWTVGWRVALAMAAVAVVVAGLWWLSVATARKYERRVTQARPELNARWPFTQPGFWRGEALVRRQRALHSAAALAAVALIGAVSAGPQAAARQVAVIVAALALAVAAASACAPLAERYKVTLVEGGKPQHDRAGTWCRCVLGVAVAALVTAALVSGWTEPSPGPQHGVLPGLTTFAGVLLAAQAALLVSLTLTVALLVRRAAPGRDDNLPREQRPYLGGMLGALFAALGVLLGGLLTAVVSLGVTRLIGMPVPSGFRFATMRPDVLGVPWPIYVFAAAPLGALAGALVVAVLLGRTYRNDRRGFEATAERIPSKVAAAYRDPGTELAAAAGESGDGHRYAKHRRAVARAWAVGLLADHAGAALAWVVIGGTLVVLTAEIAAARLAGPVGHPRLMAGMLEGAASFIALLGVLAAGWLVSRLRKSYTNATSRRNIGALWDVFTFWPRAVHPLAPPCYGERAVPELVDRIRVLTGHAGKHPDDAAYLHADAEQTDLPRTRELTVPRGPVLLTGYSQGSVIAAAVIAQLPPEVCEHVGLLTLACPARRLYGRAFPAFFGKQQLDALSELLEADARSDGRGRWKNLCRRSDYYGSWIFVEPGLTLSDDDLTTKVDQPCRDPVVLVPDANPTPPPIHRHSSWFQDPRTGELGTHLVKLLAGRAGT
jgi:hypothetical protein